MQLENPSCPLGLNVITQWLEGLVALHSAFKEVETPSFNQDTPAPLHLVSPFVSLMTPVWPLEAF